MPETQLHLELRTLLYQLLSDHLGLDATVGSDQFVYFDAADPKQCVAPDVYIRLEPRRELVRSWKTWERGAPEVAVELVSESDATGSQWQAKLQSYRTLGVRELVRFEPSAVPTPGLRIWDRVNDRLVEREVTSTTEPSSVLPIYWVVGPAENHPLTLRIADDLRALVPTRAEARDAARQRIAELEAELKRVKGD